MQLIARYISFWKDISIICSETTECFMELGSSKFAHRYRNTIYYPVRLLGIPCKVESSFLISSITACRFLRVLLNLVLSQNLGNRSLIFFLQKPNQALSESIVSNSPTIHMVIISLSLITELLMLQRFAMCGGVTFW